MEQIGAFLHGLIAQHPFLYTLLVVPASLWLLNKAESKLPAAADWFEAYQERQLKKAGLSEEEIIAVEERQLKDMRVAINEFEQKILARKAALPPPPPLPSGSVAS